MANAGPMVFSLQAGRGLAARVCDRLGGSPADHEEREFEDGEHKIRPLQSVRDRDVYLVQSLHGEPSLSVNDKLCRLLFFLGALRDAGAGRLTAVVPYLCYARKDRQTKSRDPVTTRYVATLFEAVGLDCMVTVDVHNPAAYQNAFRIRTEHLTARRLFVDHFVSSIGERPAVVVSPDAGGVKRAERFREALGHRLGRPVGAAFLDKSRSEGVVRGGAVVGDVSGGVAIIIDDLISSGTTMVRAAAACRQRGAQVVYAAATHGVFSAGAGKTLADSELEQVVVLDTVDPHLDPGDRLVVLDSAPLLAAAIERLHGSGSIVELLGHPGPA